MKPENFVGMADKAREHLNTAKDAVANMPGRAPLHSDKARARAEVIRLFARQKGVEGRIPDILDALTKHRGKDDSYGPEAILAGMKAAGLIAEAQKANRFGKAHFPALALMTSGQIVLVLAQNGAMLTVYDDKVKDRRTEVPVSEFAPVFSGVILRGEAPIEGLSATHAGLKDKKHWFWGQFGRFSRHFGEVAIGSFVANMLAVAVALFSLQVYDRVIPHQSEATLWVLAAGAGLALLLEGFLKAARAQLLDGAGRQIEMGVQQLLMDRLLGMRSEIAARSPSQLFSAMREFGSVREFFTASTVGAVADLPFIFLFLFMVWSIAGSVVWVLIAGGILMVVPGLLLQRRMVRLTREMQGASTKQARLLQEVVGELDTIKATRGEDRFRRLWAEMTAVQSVKTSEQRKLSANLTFWAQAIQQGTYVGAVITGTYLVFAGNFTVGAIIATGILTSRTLAPLTQLSGIMSRWGNVKTALDGLDEIAEAEQDRNAARKYLRRERVRGQYELSNVTYAYGENNAALDIPALGIQPGQSIAILGSNGAGKSTFLRLLSGLYGATEGRILLDGVEISQIDPSDLRRSIGYLGQDVRLFAGTLRDNLNLSMLEADDNRLYQALDFAGLGQYVKSHPEGLDMAIGDGGSGLSVGQRQSIGWARLWLQDPEIVLLDEPTAALDQTLEKTLISRLAKWLPGRTAVIATHRVPILSLASRTLILNGGRMAVDGPRDQVLDHLQRAAGGTRG